MTVRYCCQFPVQVKDVAHLKYLLSWSSVLARQSGQTGHPQCPRLPLRTVARCNTSVRATTTTATTGATAKNIFLLYVWFGESHLGSRLSGASLARGAGFAW